MNSPSLAISQTNPCDKVSGRMIGLGLSYQTVLIENFPDECFRLDFSILSTSICALQFV